MSTSDKVIIEVVIAAPIETVWRALRDPAEIRTWFGWDYPGLEEEIAMIFDTGANASEAEHTIQFGEYQGVSDRFELEPRGAGTLLRVIRSGPAGTDWDGIYDEVVEGWRTFIQQLRFAMERQGPDARRTLYLSGHSREGGPRPPAALGIDAISPGDRYEVTIAPGDTLTGAVWFRHPNQIGLTVDGFGNGLLIVHNRQPTPTSPHGGGMAVLTLFGCDDARFDALRARWIAWWTSQFDRTEVQPPSQG
jgi:uncharacterized protein YndB with AHSA1/START domain